MAQKRMFSKIITNSEEFFELPATSQLLYFHLNMNADDDGFVQPKRIMRMTGIGGKDDLKILHAKGFILPVADRVIVIRHWHINNTLKSDRYTPTLYKEHLKNLGINEETKEYEIVRKQLGTTSEPQVSIGKYSKDKESKEKSSKFSPPSISDISEYATSINYNLDANNFYDFYSSKGWMVGKNKMKDWQAAVRTWKRREKEDGKKIEIKREVTAEAKKQSLIIKTMEDFGLDWKGAVEHLKKNNKV